MIGNDRQHRHPMNVPRNVLWFEVLLYLSLTLDALSVAFQDRTPSADMTEQMIDVGDRDGGRPDPAAGLFRLARRAAPQELAALGAGGGAGAVGDFAGAGRSARTACSSTAPSRSISCALTAAGLYFSFTGDAAGLVQRVSVRVMPRAMRSVTRAGLMRFRLDASAHRIRERCAMLRYRRNPVNSAHGMDRRRHRAGRAAAWRILRHRRTADARAMAAISAWCAAAPARGCGRCCSPATASRAVWRARLDEHLGYLRDRRHAAARGDPAGVVARGLWRHPSGLAGAAVAGARSARGHLRDARPHAGRFRRCRRAPPCI